MNLSKELMDVSTRARDKKINPDEQLLYNNLAIIYYDNQNYNEAIIYYKKALDLAINDFEIDGVPPPK